MQMQARARVQMAEMGVRPVKLHITLGRMGVWYVVYVHRQRGAARLAISMSERSYARAAHALAKKWVELIR